MLKRSLLFFLVLSVVNLLGQINTGNPSKPFGSNTSYEFGIMPAGQATNDTDIQTEYNNWKTKYVENCGADKARVKFDNTAQTVSEGIAYGMLVAVYASDKDLFDRLWAYYKNFRNTNGVMHWKIDGCNTVNSQNGATDAELDAAMALIVATKQWPSNSTPHNYKTDGVALINAIKSKETSATDYTFFNGDQWHPDCRNPSYQSPAYARAFKLFMAENGTNQDAFWTSVAAGTEKLLINNAHSTSGLSTNWCTPAGPPDNSCSGSGTAPDKFGYDACRAPWRESIDVLWWGPTATGQMQAIISRQSAFWTSKGGATKVQGSNNVNWDGSGTGDHNGAFTGMIGAMSLGATSSASNQTLCNDLYTENKKTAMDNGYFTAILRIVGLFVQSGNFWNPYATTGTIANKPPTVSLTSPTNNSSVCQGASITITANTSDSDGTISKVEFYNGNILLNSDNTSPYTFDYTPTTASTLSITAKAYDDKNEFTISTALSVTVNAAPNAPSTANSTINYCLNNNASALVATGSNLKWYTQANGGTSSSNAPTPATNKTGATIYYVSQTINNCESQRAAITVNVNESSAPVANATVNYCQGQTATALTATGTSLKWYSQASGGTTLVTAPTPTTTNTGTTVFYVSQTLNTCESARTSVNVVVSQATVTPNTSSVNYCQGATAIALTATGTNLKWYTTQTGGNSSASIVASTTTVGNTTYYVSQTSGSCESSRAALVVTISLSPTAPIVKDLTYLLNATSTALTATGTNLKWYAQSSGGSSSSTAPKPSTSTAGLTNYYVTQTSGTCESPRAILAVSVIDALLVGKTSVAPVIDGTVDPIWSRVGGQTFTKLIQGTVSNANDLSGTFKVLWDDNYFYVLGEIVDDVLVNESANTYEDDAVEVFFDFGNKKSTTYGATDVQYTFWYNDNTTIGVSVGGKTTGISYKITPSTNGYVFETRIPWSTLGGSGAVDAFHGFEFEVNDDDDKGARDAKLAWNATVDDAYRDPSYFGNILLGDLISVCDKPAKPTLTASKLEVCDGETITLTSAISNASNLSIQWLNGNNVIANQTSTSLTISASGQYSVMYYSLDPNNSNCTNTSNSVLLTVNPKPNTPLINGASKACIYSPTEIYNYSVNKTNGSTYLWTSTKSTIKSGNFTSAISVEFAKSFNATAGTIEVVETNSKNCVSAKATFQVSFDCPNAVFEKKETSVNVYPNPFDEQLFADGYETYEILDLEGRLIESGSVENGLISTNTLSKAVYILKLSNSKETQVVKVIKE